MNLTIIRIWTISPAQIYPALDELERRKLITGRDDPRGRRPRRVYRITREGERVLEEWLARDEPLPFELRDIGLVKVFFADLLEQGSALDLLDTIRRRSSERVAQLEALRPAASSVAEDEGYAFPLVTLRLGLAYHAALAEECAAIAQELGEGRSQGPARRAR